MNWISFSDRVLNSLNFDDEGGGGDIGDVSDIPNGLTGDLEIMGRNDKETPAETPDGEEEAEKEPEGEKEVFDQVDEEEEEGDEEKEKPDGEEEKDDKDKEVFQGRPSLTDIKKKYPQIFKEFPELREVIFRESELSKHFGSVDDAEAASAKASSFDMIETALMGGDSSPIINSLAANAPEALASVVDNFLPTLLGKSQDLYLRATIPVIEQFLHNTYAHGKATNNANLMRSAQHAAQFIFGKPEIPDPARRQAQGPHPAEAKLEEERKTWQQTRFKEASQEVSSAIDAEIDAEILKGFSVKGMSDRQKARFIQDVKDEIDATLAKDEAFGKSMKSLWAKAGQANYPKEQRASIKSAFLARAKALVPSVRTRLRGEWFGDQPSNSGGTDKNKNQPPKKRVIPTSGGSTSGGNRRPPTPQEIDYSKTSDMDLIEGKFARKR